MLFNQFDRLPYIPYRIIEYMANNNENIWKIMKYRTYDCISQPNLSLSDKLALVWRGDSDQNKYNVFLNRVVEDAEPDATSIFKIYRLDSKPINHLLSTVSYEFDFIYGNKISLIDYNGIPCNIGDVFETELMQTLNGKDVGGVGLIQFNHELSTLSRSGVTSGNNKTYSGYSAIMCVQVGNVGA